MPSIAILHHKENNNVASGGYVLNTRVVRPLNTKTSDPDNIVTLDAANNRFSLEAGKYLIIAKVHFQFTANSRAYIVNHTDSTTVGQSINKLANNIILGAFAKVSAHIDISSTKEFQIECQCSRTRSNDGFGQRVNLGYSEYYMQVKIEKL